MLRDLKKRKGKKLTGQVILEFTFSMMVVFIMIYSLIMLMRWVGMDQAERRMSHYATLRANVAVGNQLSPYFYDPMPMNLIFAY